MGDAVHRQRVCVRRTPVCVALSAVLALVVLLLVSAAGAAAAGIGFEARPLPGSQTSVISFFKFDAKPGSDVSQTLLLINRTSKAKTLRLAACDGAAAVFGGVSYTDSDKTPHVVGSWVQLSQTTVQLPAGGSVRVPFVVRVPADVTSGVHLGGIALWEPKAATTTGSSGSSSKASTKITMITRIVLPVFVTTPGPATADLKITGVKAEARSDGMYVIVGLASDGTAPASGNGTVGLPDQGFKGDISLGAMIPQSSTRYPIKWKTDPAKGTYQAQVQIIYANGTKTANWAGTFTVGSAQTKDLANRLVKPQAPAGSSRPWLMYGLIGTLVLIVLIMGFALLRRRRPEAKS